APSAARHHAALSSSTRLRPAGRRHLRVPHRAAKTARPQISPPAAVKAITGAAMRATIQAHLFAGMMLTSCVDHPAQVLFEVPPPALSMDRACMGSPSVPDAKAALELGEMIARAKLSSATLSHGVWTVMNSSHTFGYFIDQCDGSVLVGRVTAS